MQLTSPAFQPHGILPINYTCRGQGVNPHLLISDIPADAESLVLIMHDPDAVGGQDFLHWAVWGISPEVTDIGENSVPSSATQGTNDQHQIGYVPACPPPGTGTHHYTFDLYALDGPILLPEGADRDILEEAIEDHVIATAQLVGIVES